MVILSIVPCRIVIFRLEMVVKIFSLCLCTLKLDYMHRNVGEIRVEKGVGIIKVDNHNI
jgi:hypothetical protein